MKVQCYRIRRTCNVTSDKPKYKEIHDHEIVILKKMKLLLEVRDGNVVEHCDSYIAEIDASGILKKVFMHAHVKRKS